MEGYEDDALRLVEVSKKFGMTGIGIKQDSKTPLGKRFIHLDNLGSNYTKLTGGPRPLVVELCLNLMYHLALNVPLFSLF